MTEVYSAIGLHITGGGAGEWQITVQGRVVFRAKSYDQCTLEAEYLYQHIIANEALFAAARKLEGCVTSTCDAAYGMVPTLRVLAIPWRP